MWKYILTKLLEVKEDGESFSEYLKGKASKEDIEGHINRKEDIVYCDKCHCLLWSGKAHEVEEVIEVQRGCDGGQIIELFLDKDFNAMKKKKIVSKWYCNVHKPKVKR